MRNIGKGDSDEYGESGDSGESDDSGDSGDSDDSGHSGDSGKSDDSSRCNFSFMLSALIFSYSDSSPSTRSRDFLLFTVLW